MFLGGALTALQDVGNEAAQWLGPNGAPMSCGGSPIKKGNSGVGGILDDQPVEAARSASDIERLLRTIGDSLTIERPLPVPAARQLIEALRQLTEALVWGDRHDSGLFDLFCERQALAGFVTALLSPSTSQVVRVQLLQTLSILVQNARRDTSFYYLLSGGHLNTLLAGEPDLHDEEVLAYFVAFVKSLSSRIDGETALLFLDRRPGVVRAGGFPLFAQAVRFATHRDHMVCTAARAALLRLLTVDQPEVRRHAADITCCVLVPSLARALRITWTAASTALRHDDAETLRASIIAEEDILGLLNELLLLGAPAVTEGVTRGFLAGALLPLMAGLSPLLAYPEHPGECAHEQENIPPRRPKASNSLEQRHVDERRLRKKKQWSIGCKDVNELGSGENVVAAAEIAHTVANHVFGLNDQPLQQSLVGAVIDRVLAHKPTASVGPKQKCDDEPKSAGLAAHSLLQGTINESLPRSAIVLRAVAASCVALGRHQNIIEPLAHALMWPSIPSSLVAAIYAPGPEGEALAALAFEVDEIAGGGCSESVLIPNPFRTAMIELLSGRDPDAVPREAPLVTWVLRELQAALPQIQSIFPQPERIVSVLSARARLPRFAQRTVVAAIVDLVAQLRDRIARRHTASFAIAALREAGELLHRILRPNIDSCSSSANVSNSSQLISEFLEEWEWDQHYCQPTDPVAACSSAEHMLELTNIQGCSSVGPAGQAARALLTLRQLCASLSVLIDSCDGWAVTSRAPLATHAGCQRKEPCPLDAGMKDCAAGVDPADVEVIACIGPMGAACGFTLHPGLLLVTAWPPSISRGGGREGETKVKAPLWQASAAVNTKEPWRLSVLVPAGAARTASREMVELELRFADTRSCAHARKHFEQCRERQMQRLLSQLVSFAQTTVREAEAELPKLRLLSGVMPL